MKSRWIIALLIALVCMAVPAISGDITIEADGEPDLVITAIWTVPDGANTIIHYNITNNGGTEAGESMSMVTVDGVALNQPSNADELAPGATSEVTYNYRGTPLSSIMVCADSKNKVTESNEANNCLFVMV
jgi:archaellum component FlaF (FlaF/FlaG flagellin family)